MLLLNNGVNKVTSGQGKMNTFRKALQNSIKSIMKPRPFEKEKEKGKNRNKDRNKSKDRNKDRNKSKNRNKNKNKNKNKSKSRRFGAIQKIQKQF
jgi:hypothetical protein